MAAIRMITVVTKAGELLFNVEQSLRALAFDHTNLLKVPARGVHLSRHTIRQV